MRGSLSVLVAAVVVCVGATSWTAVEQASAPKGLTEAQFEANCGQQGGRFTALNGQVLCALDREQAVVCQAGSPLGICLSTGQIGVAALASILGDPHRA